jgi:hypothetical protein
LEVVVSDCLGSDLPANERADLLCDLLEQVVDSPWVMDGKARTMTVVIDAELWDALVRLAGS